MRDRRESERESSGMHSMWTIMLTYLGPCLGGVAALYGWLQLRKSKGRRFPVTDKVFRSPGPSLSRALDDATWDLAGSLMLPLFPVVTYVYYLQVLLDGQSLGTMATSIMFGTASIVTGYFLARLVRIVARVGRLRAGLAGEVAVGQTLNQLMLPGYRVFHGIPGDRGFNPTSPIQGVRK
jgi:uncharacterized membrane protein (GlpM family)